MQGMVGGGRQGSLIISTWPWVMEMAKDIKLQLWKRRMLGNRESMVGKHLLPLPVLS